MEICKDKGLAFSGSFDSSIRFPKKNATAYGFLELLEKYLEDIIRDEIFVTEKSAIIEMKR